MKKDDEKRCFHFKKRGIRGQKLSFTTSQSFPEYKCYSSRKQILKNKVPTLTEESKYENNSTEVGTLKSFLRYTDDVCMTQVITKSPNSAQRYPTNVLLGQLALQPFQGF